MDRGGVEGMTEHRVSDSRDAGEVGAVDLADHGVVGHRRINVVGSDHSRVFDRRKLDYGGTSVSGGERVDALPGGEAIIRKRSQQRPHSGPQ